MDEARKMQKREDPAEVFGRLATERHSCRAFLSQPLGRERIEQLLAMAQRAPSDCNTQGWKTYLLSGAPLEALGLALSDHVSAGGVTSPDVNPVVRYEGVLQDRRRACGWGLYEAVGVKKGDRGASHRQRLENYRFFGAPHLAVITSEVSMAARGVFDAGIYTGFFLLAAEAMQIATIPQASVTHHADIIRRHTGIPQTQLILCAVAFGEEDRTHPANAFRTSRATMTEYAVWIDQAASENEVTERNGLFE
jgi:nitroreductase